MTLKGNRFEVIDKEESNQRRIKLVNLCVLRSKETHTNKCHQKREAREAKALLENEHQLEKRLALDLHTEAAVQVEETTLTKLLSICL